MQLYIIIIIILKLGIIQDPTEQNFFEFISPRMYAFLEFNIWVQVFLFKKGLFGQNSIIKKNVKGKYFRLLY